MKNFFGWGSSTWPVSALVLAAAGLAVAGTGLYFIFLRPPLLPEDVRYQARINDGCDYSIGDDPGFAASSWMRTSVQMLAAIAINSSTIASRKR